MYQTLASINNNRLTGRLVSSTPHTQQIILRPIADTVIFTLTTHTSTKVSNYTHFTSLTGLPVFPGPSPVHSAPCQPGSRSWRKRDLTVSVLNTLQCFLLHWLRTKPCCTPRPARVWRLPARGPHGSPQPPATMCSSLPHSLLPPHKCALGCWDGMRFLPPPLRDASSCRSQRFPDRGLGLRPSHPLTSPAAQALTLLPIRCFCSSPAPSGLSSRGPANSHSPPDASHLF